MGDKNKITPAGNEADTELCAAIGELSDNITHLSKMVMQLQRTLNQTKTKAEKATGATSCTVH